MRAADPNAHDKPNSGKTEDPARTQEQTQREGPPRQAPQLDQREQWPEAAQDPGYTPPDQGGYKGEYDQGKYENRDFGFPTRDSHPDAAAEPRGQGGGQHGQVEPAEKPSGRKR